MNLSQRVISDIISRKGSFEIPELCIHHCVERSQYTARINSLLSPPHQARRTPWLAKTALLRALALRPVPSPGSSSSSVSVGRKLAHVFLYVSRLSRSTAKKKVCRICSRMSQQAVCRMASRQGSTCARTPSVAHRLVRAQGIIVLVIFCINVNLELLCSFILFVYIWFAVCALIKWFIF